mgnify:CR=1 FL=1
MQTVLGILIPFLGTTAGAACVFFMKKSLGDLVQRSLAGFAAGVMVAASIWSLLIPAIEQSAALGKLAFFPAFAGFWLGVLFLLALDHLIPHLHVGSEQAEGPKSRLARTTMMVLAVTLHNIPEGMAVGLAFALAGVEGGFAGAAVLALGIGVQNLPEGLAVALPFRAGGMSRGRSFALGALSGAVEPVFGMLAALAAGMMQGALPGMMAFCAGAMMQVVFAEMAPQAAKSRAGLFALMTGYALMMALDLALG